MACLGFSLIIPTFNERENLPELFRLLDATLRGGDFEVIVVDDDSPDQTSEVARGFCSLYPWLRVIRRREKRGLSASVICGFRNARGELLGVMDADLQHDETRLPELLSTMRDADFAIAT